MSEPSAAESTTELDRQAQAIAWVAFGTFALAVFVTVDLWVPTAKSVRGIAFFIGYAVVVLYLGAKLPNLLDLCLTGGEST